LFNNVLLTLLVINIKRIENMPTTKQLIYSRTAEQQNSRTAEQQNSRTA
jgi:hypothetical protein